ncbi:MAG: glycine--tRNA ligase subunit beta [Trueperaceae bacterium]|nr:glycine--tRNA ligase subunit beta [Trueperaceae bacterium]
MATVLFEIGTEELPSWYVRQGRGELVRLVQSRLAEVHLSHGAVHGYATPRRLTIRIDDVSAETERRTESRRGPSARVAFDEGGRPSKAASGFARGLGVDPGALVVEETDKGPYAFARIERGGEPVRDVLPSLLGGLVAALPAPRKMRWGEVDTPFVRPVRWLLARLDGEVLPVEAAGVRAGGTSWGHRFLAPGPHEIVGADDYLDVLRAAHVLADPDERHQATVRAVADAAAEYALDPVWDASLLDEVVGLVEAPTAIVGRFDTAYLALPDEVLATVMIHHQRFVPLRGEDGALAARFVGVSNTAVPDPAVVRAGYEGVLDGRLYDARFFWNADRTKTLAQHAWDLSGIAFQKGLGSMADKVTRVRDSAPRLAEALGAPDEVRTALEKALPLFRADLTTEMVGEFPELEGIMARRYAEAEGLPDTVARTLEDGVRPLVPDGALPLEEPGAILAASDRADTLLGFFALGKRPSGSTDPYGLRRSAAALARICATRDWALPLRDLLRGAERGYVDGPVSPGEAVVDDVAGFVWDRVASLLAEEGIGVTTVRAATAGEPPVILAARRAHLLRALAGTEAFAELMTLYKRAANLAEKADENAVVEPSRFEAPEEAPLYEALAPARAGVQALLEDLRRQLAPWKLGAGPDRRPDPGEGLNRVLALKEPLDRFLDDVLVMVDDRTVQANRLALLRDTRDVLRGLGALERLGG